MKRKEPTNGKYDRMRLMAEREKGREVKMKFIEVTKCFNQNIMAD